MPQPWRPLLLRLGGGQEADKDPGAGHAGADRVENCAFDREGALFPRPGYTRDTMSFEVRGTGAGFSGGSTQTFAQATAAFRALLRGLGDAGERPIVLNDGHVWTKDDDRWTDRLGAWCTRVTRGVDVVGGFGFGGSASTVLPKVAWDFNLNAAPMLLTQDGRAAEGYGSAAITNLGGNVPGTARCGTVSGAFWIDGNNLRCALRSNGALTVTQTLLATDAQVVGTVPQGVWASSSANAAVFYVAYATTTLGHVKVLRVSTAGAVLTTVDLNVSAATVLSLCVDNSSTKVVLAVTFVGGANVITKVLDATTLADQAIDGAILKTGAGDARGVVCGAVDNTANRAFVAWTTVTNDDLHIADRSLTAATATFRRSYLGSTAAAGVPAVRWQTKHQPVLWRGRAVLGISVGPDSNEHTWYDLDVTDVAGADGILPRSTLVARGPLRASSSTDYPHAAILSTTGWRFMSTEYNSFDITGGDVFSLCVINVEPTEPTTVEVGGKTMITGSVPYTIDEYAHETGFPFLGGAPELAGVVQAGGAMAVGSYTARGIWVWTDSTGRVHRSAPSLPVTLSTTAGNQTIAYKLTTCQLTAKSGILASGGLSLELYITTTNPGPFDALYLQSRSSNDTTVAVKTFSIIGTPVTNSDPLYTTGGVLANFPPSAPAGAAVLGRRVWVADQFRANASKLGRVDANEGRTWSDEGIVEVRPPASAGSIRALASLDDKLAMFCERGIYVTFGDGPDDQAIGQDFLTPYHVSDIGVAHARSVASTPDGIVFESGGTVYILDRGLSVQEIGRPVTDDIPANAVVDYDPINGLVVLSSINAGTMPVLDVRAKRWAVWQEVSEDIEPSSVVFVAGQLWWAAGSAAMGVFDDSHPGNDYNGGSTPFSQLFRTAHLPIADSGFGWGRVRSVNILGHALGATTHTVTVDVNFDRQNAAGYTDSVVVDPADRAASADPAHPYAPEFRLTRQKCSEMQVTLRASPGLARWNALELRVNPRPNRAPQTAAHRT